MPASTQDNLMLRMKDEEWQKTLDVNLSGNFHLCKRAIKPMVKARWGRILLVGSVVGSTGNLGQANYAAAKAGLIGLGRSLAREFASRNISVNILAPGFIETDMTGELDEKIREELLNEYTYGIDMARPRKSPRWCLFWYRKRQDTSPARSCTSTAECLWAAKPKNYKKLKNS